MFISDTEILILDCQATGANPQTGHLLEMGWMRCAPDEKGTFGPRESETHFVQFPGEADIPRRVQHITGIAPEDLKKALSPSETWSRLLRSAEKVAGLNDHRGCPTIIHFAKYEMPFIRDLHRMFGPDAPFPFETICTHEIARRMMPGLPRKGLRAVAGYLGFSTPEKRRCRNHLNATLFIWNRLAEEMRREVGLRRFEEIHRWLKQPIQAGKPSRVYPMERSLRLGLQDSPGVYRFLRSNGDVLYIGKAKSLKKRVNSYFQKSRNQPEHILEMLSQACNIDYTATDSAVEAAILESDAIKACSPPYNIALKTRDRTIGFSSEDFSRHAPTPDEICPIGPLPSKDALTPLFVLSELLGGRSFTRRDGPALLDMADEYAPPEAMVKDGFEEFITRHGAILDCRFSYGDLMRMGALFWKKRLEEKAAAGLVEDDYDSAGEDGMADTAGEWEWTVEAVANGMEHMIRRSFHLVRRARWFCLISESSLAWQRNRPEDPDRNLLIFESGRMINQGTEYTTAAIPVPTGCGKDRLSRQQGFDLETYDRMRVVTTEVRRLISEGRGIELKLRPRGSLKNKSLGQFLLWV